MWWLFFLAVWPLLGTLVLWQANRALGRKGQPQLAPVEGGAEVLARMYLWPLVLLGVLRSPKKGDQQSK